jgi:hypothetical protein
MPRHCSSMDLSLPLYKFCVMFLSKNGSASRPKQAVSSWSSSLNFADQTCLTVFFPWTKCNPLKLPENRWNWFPMLLDQQNSDSCSRSTPWRAPKLWSQVDFPEAALPNQLKLPRHEIMMSVWLTIPELFDCQHASTPCCQAIWSGAHSDGIICIVSSQRVQVLSATQESTLAEQPMPPRL